jgi:hypothetical protein
MRNSKLQTVPIALDFYKQMFQCSASGRAWERDGVGVSHGTPICMPYNGTTHYGIIDDRAFFVEGKRYRSPSEAAMGVARTREGTQPNLNGWRRWKVKRPGDPEWVSLDSLRPKEAVRRRAARRAWARLSPAEQQRIREAVLA